jgi:uncharacterized iron-regulated protein
MEPMIRALALCLSLLGATVAAASEPDLRTWAEEAQKQHALAGQVYDPALGRLSTLHQLALPSSPGIVLLGEVHDNPHHHRVRARLIAESLQAHPSRRPAVVFEHIRADQQPALDQFKALDQQCCRLITAVDLLRLLEWDKSGWPPAEIYRPLFDAVIAGSLPTYPGDPPRDRVRAVARGGLAALAAEEQTRLGVDAPLPDPLAEALHRELADSHCGALPPQAIPGMALAQRYRDAHQADALIAAAAVHGSAFLIAGNGHVRSDRGVPWHIRRRQPDARVTSVLLIEVEEGKTDPAAYVPRDPAGKPAADTIIFTPRAERGDPCAGFTQKRK